MKKKYIKPIVEVEKLLAEGLMQDGHSFNMPTAKIIVGLAKKMKKVKFRTKTSGTTNFQHCK